MFLGGIFNANIAIDMFFGMLAGAGVFLIITLIGGFIAGDFDTINFLRHTSRTCLPF